MQWQISDSQAQRRTYEGDDNAPAWWYGDEEASSSFMRSMGIQLE